MYYKSVYIIHISVIIIFFFYLRFIFMSVYVIITYAGKDYEFVFEDQIEFISTEVLKNTLKQKEESSVNKHGVDDEEDEEDGDSMSVSMGKRDSSSSSISIVKAKKETAHQKILAGFHYQHYSLS